MADERVRLDYDGAIAMITNNNPHKHNAFDDEMDLRLWEILSELKANRDVRAVIWRAEGKSWSSGRDTSNISSLGQADQSVSHHELMTRGHAGILQVFDMNAPIIVAVQGWAIGGSFQRALLCDIRIAAEGARFMLPEVGHGVIPDTGGVGRLFQICGHGVVSDMVLTGRPMLAAEALHHGVVSRVVPPDQLDSVAREMAEKIAASPTITVKMARRVIRNLGDAAVRSSMGDELIYQTFVNKSDDFAEFRAARAEGRPPKYTGS
jgi:enoyl-CoA hydratase/carnithine racemase